jgi:hypothetical protein
MAIRQSMRLSLGLRFGEAGHISGPHEDSLSYFVKIHQVLTPQLTENSL